MQGAQRDCDDLEGWDEGWGGRELREEGIHTHTLMADLCCTAETNTTL